jgi:VIT1/CCC1 family predicted Fe2+/Mn2+ transporter/rubrerythrin
MTAPSNEKILTALEANWQAEMEGYSTYKFLSERESDAARRNAFRGLAVAEKHHADLWAGRIRALGGPEPVYGGKPSGLADSLANRVGGPELALRRLEIDESRDIARYGRQITELGDEGSIAVLNEVIADEREHYRTLGALIRTRPPLPDRTPDQAKEALDDLLNSRKHGHPEAASWVGDAIYGINDGLGSIFGIVSGVSGATLGNAHFVLIAGLAGMVASALSMGSGAYLASKSEREIYEAEFARERDSVYYNESEAREVLSLSYQMRGLPEDDAKHFVEHLAQNKDQLVQALARERINTTEEGLSKPMVSAISGALSTAVGAFIPIIPFFFMAGIPAVVVAAIVSLIAHFAVGAAKSLVTIRSWWSSGIEMTTIGAVEGVVTYVIGMGLGRIGGG